MVRLCGAAVGGVAATDTCGGVATDDDIDADRVEDGRPLLTREESLCDAAEEVEAEAVLSEGRAELLLVFLGRAWAEGP